MPGNLAPVQRSLTPRQRNRHRNRLLVEVQTNICGLLDHDLPASMWLCVQWFLTSSITHDPRGQGRSTHDVQRAFLTTVMAGAALRVAPRRPPAASRDLTVGTAALFGPFVLGEPDPVGFVRRAFADGAAGADIPHRNAAQMFNLVGQEAETWKPASQP